MRSATREPGPGAELHNDKAHGAAHLVACSNCQHSNGADRKFCTKCGGLLWRKCLKCGTECAGSEVFCGHCGANYQELVAKHVMDVETALRRANEFRSQGDHGQALGVLRSLPVVEHPEVQVKLAQARQLGSELAEERKRLERESESATQQAEQEMAQRRYKEVVLRLQAVPRPFRSERGRQLLDMAESAYREIKNLRAEIATNVEARRLQQLAPQIDRYLSLQPDDDKVRILAGRVRDHVAAKVREAVAASDYEQANRLLEGVPRSAIDDPTQQLESEVRELQHLSSELQSAPHVDAGLLTVAQRLFKLSPRDAKLPNVISQMTKRIQQGPEDPRFPIVPWVPKPRRSHLGPPVDWLGGFRRLRGSSTAVDEALRRHCGMFFVAAGLALHGIGRAAVSINLLPTSEPSGLLGRLGRLRKTPTIKGAWGLDVGRSAIKAIKLSVPEHPTAEPAILACDYFPHRLNLAAPEAETQQAEIVRESLQAWRDRYQPGEDEAICVNGQATKMLARFFQIPSVNSKKIADIVSYEVGQQIPYPLAELTWGFQVLEPANGHAEQKPSEPGGLRSVVVAAMRASDSRDQLQPFIQLGLPVQHLLAESLALYNFLSYEQFDEPASGKKTVEADHCIALLDLGSDATNLVVCSPDHVWFRTLRWGGNDVNQALIREFKLTFGQAEDVKRQIDKARKLANLLDTFDQVSSKLASETLRSLEAFNKERPDRRVDRLWLCGGAAHQFGILRLCRTGPRRGPG